jgi:regulator of cell morphogenesis and NO signaling
MTTLSTPLRDIVTENFNSAAVLEKYGLDFCCKGAMSLKDACLKKNLTAEKVIKDLSELDANESSQRFFCWDIPFLIDYILNNHHAYVRYQTPLISIHLDKVIHEHGEKYPELKEANAVFRIYSKELADHMMKEEKILFPFIKEIARSYETHGDPPHAYFSSIGTPIAIMREEHADVGKELEHIRNLLHNYAPPEDACMTMKLLYKELEAFEHDLHMHVFLENTILFPKSMQMEKELYGMMHQDLAIN